MGNKRHVAHDLDEGGILAAEVLPANPPDTGGLEPLLIAVELQHRQVTLLPVEHGLAPVSQHQGNEARYCGARQNTGHLRLGCAIQNLERAQALSQQAAANDAEPVARLAA